MASIEEIQSILPSSRNSRMSLVEICAMLGLEDCHKGPVTRRLFKLIRDGKVRREKLDLPYYPWGYFLATN